MTPKTMEGLATEYLRTRSRETESLLCDALCVSVISFIRKYYARSDQPAYILDDMESCTKTSILTALRKWNGIGSLFHYVRKLAWLRSIDVIRTMTRFRRKTREIASGSIEEFGAEDPPLSEQANEEVAAILACMSVRERDVIEAVFLQGEQQKTVAARLGVHPSRISQIIRGALDKVRDNPPKESLPEFVRITIMGNAYRAKRGGPVSAKDIRRRLAGKTGFRPLPGFDRAKVYYHKFLKKEWLRVGRGLTFETGMAFQVLVKPKGRRGCRIVKGPRGGIAFACSRGD